MKNLCLIVLLVFSFLPSFSQKRCATEERHSYFNKPQRDSIFENWISEKTLEKQLRRAQSRTFEEVYTVPVVVHVIHGGEPVGIGSNISDQQIFSQIEALNEDFRRQNSDTVNTPDMFKPVAEDAGVNFVLAKQDPFGGRTNGIVRVMSSQSTWSYYDHEALLKSLSYWPAEEYINIWVVNELAGNWIAYSTYPVTDLPGITEPNFNRLIDGIVISRFYFGSNSKGTFELDKSYDKGRSLTHEMGHYLGLRHIWGDGPCEVDDRCDDTPPASNSHNNCPAGVSIQCGFESMFQNFMDYTPDRCMNLFTVCQISRMRTVLENSPRRLSLRTSPGLIPPEEYDLDLAYYRIVNPSSVSCQRIMVPEVELVNLGTQTVHSFKVAYAIQGVVSDTILFENLDLEQDKSFITELKHVNLENGSYKFSTQIVEVNGDKDYNQSNDAKSISFLVNDQSDFIPLIERFDGRLSWENLDWSVLNEDGEQGWDLQYTTNGIANNVSATINSHEYETVGQRDWLVSPALDFSEAEESGLWFKLSYAHRETRNDKLSIMASTDCGRSFPFLLYEKAGEGLAVESSAERWKPSGAEDWLDEYVDLTVVAGRQDVRIAFVWTNGNGNAVYLDDIEFFASQADDPIVNTKNDFLIFPNPLNGTEVNLALRLAERQDIVVSVYDALGRQTSDFKFENALNQVIKAPFSPQLPAGIYIISLKGPNINKSKRLIVY